MRCVSLQAFPPHKYNLQAPTANPFQLMRYAPDSVDIDLYYFEGAPEHRESSERCIGTLRLGKIRSIQRKSGLGRYASLAAARTRGLPGSVGMFPVIPQVLQEMNAEGPELVWMYPHWLVDWVPRLECDNIVVTGPDSAVLHNERALRYGKLTPPQKREQLRLLSRNMKLEGSLGRMDVRVHMVGKRDAERFEELTGHQGKAFFVPHPLYDYSEIKEKITERSDRLRVLFSGGGGKVFDGDHLERIVAGFVKTSGENAKGIELRFVGKGYESQASTLRAAGYGVTQADWVPSYEDELASAHVHVFPQAVGTGTKGRVLTALATGLLCIGTEFAFENIAVEPGKSCVQYHEPEEVPTLLRSVLDNPDEHEAIAARGASDVRREHDPKRTAAQFWNLAGAKPTQPER
ncbi:MAG TPA: glycosyltransferase [Methanomassiliicoccales archaeon]|nr:glycosyltransferase [Methanomassiliicoccales archaeon]